MQSINQQLIQRNSSRLALALFFVALLAANSASATFIGSTATLEARYPNLATVAASFGSSPVSGAVEYPSIFSGAWSSDIDGFSITLNQHANSNSIGTGAFNGFVYSFAGAPAIASVTLDGLSTLVPTGITFSASTIEVNYAGYGVATPSSTILNVSFVPEPSTGFLCAVGLLGLVRAARVRRVGGSGALGL